MKASPDVADGFYARKQLFSRSRLISWAHRRRFATGVHLARRFAGRRVVDVGCGDGTFLALLMAGPYRPASAFGVDVAQDAVDDCRRRLREIGDLAFDHVSALRHARHEAAYDGVISMEVLEHVVDLERELDALVRLLAPGGELLVSVPVETGLPLLIKQTVRRIAGWRGIGDYPGLTPYTVRELANGVFAGRRQHIVRPVHRPPDGEPFHDHKGFNWMALRDMLRARLRVTAVTSSPIGWLPPHLASQAWFVATR